MKYDPLSSTKQDHVVPLQIVLWLTQTSSLLTVLSLTICGVKEKPLPSRHRRFLWTSLSTKYCKVWIIKFANYILMSNYLWSFDIRQGIFICNMLYWYSMSAPWKHKPYCVSHLCGIRSDNGVGIPLSLFSSHIAVGLSLASQLPRVNAYSDIPGNVRHRKATCCAPACLASLLPPHIPPLPHTRKAV